MHEPSHLDEFVLVCKHITDPEVDLVVEGGDMPMVACRSCSKVDFGKVDWSKSHAAAEEVKRRGLEPGSEEAKAVYRKIGPPEMENFALACKTCTMESIAAKIETKANENVESLGECSDCGKPVLVKHELAASLKRLVSLNPTYHFDIGVSDRELVVTIRKRGSSRVSEPVP